MPIRIFFVLFTLAPIVVRGGGFLTQSRGARAAGMAGAVSSYPSDPSIVFSNPAGIAFLRGLHVSGGAGFDLSDVERRAGGVKQETDNGALVLPAAYFTYTPMRVPVGVGVGYTEPFAFRVRWPSAAPGGERESGVTASYITAGAAGALSRQFMVGGAIHLVSIAMRDFHDDPSAAAYLAEGRGASAAVSAGILFVPITQVALSATFLSGVNVPIKGLGWGQTGGAFGSLGAFHTKLSMPAIFSLGFGFHPAANVTIEAGGDVIGWGAFDVIDLEYASSTIHRATAFENTYALRVGGEIVLDRTVPLRAGLAWLPSPVADSAVTPFFPDAGRVVLALGTGARLSKNIEFDVAYQAHFSADRTALGATYSFSRSFIAASMLFSFEPIANPLQPPRPQE